MQEAGRGGAATTDLPLNFQKTPAQTERHTQQARTHILPAKSLHLHPLWINNGQMHCMPYLENHRSCDGAKPVFAAPNPARVAPCEGKQTI